jgi:hypothetical protein
MKKAPSVFAAYCGIALQELTPLIALTFGLARVFFTEKYERKI